MPTIASAETQILLVEMQPAIVAASVTVEAARLARGASALLAIAQAAGLPIIASGVALGGEAPTLIPELGNLDLHVRSTVSPFADPTIAALLRDNGRPRVIVGGVSSEIAVLHSVLDAVTAGYEVHVLTDLCGGLHPRSDAAALERMWRAGALPSTIASVATQLIDDMAAEPGRSVMATLSEYWGWGAEPVRSIEDEIDAMLQPLAAAWRKGDADAFARPFAEHARFVAFDGTVLTGPKAIAAYHREPFATYLANTTLHIAVQEVAAAGAGAWIVASEGGIERCGDTEGASIGRSAQTFVLTRQGGTLAIAAFHNTRIRPIDGPAAAGAWHRFDEEWAALSR